MIARIPLLNLLCSSIFFLLATRHTVLSISFKSSFLKFYSFLIISMILTFFMNLSVSSQASYFSLSFASSASFPTRIGFFPFLSSFYLSSFFFSKSGSIEKSIVMNFTMKSKTYSCLMNRAAIVINTTAALLEKAKSLM